MNSIGDQDYLILAELVSATETQGNAALGGSHLELLGFDLHGDFRCAWCLLFFIILVRVGLLHRQSTPAPSPLLALGRDWSIRLILDRTMGKTHT